MRVKQGLQSDILVWVVLGWSWTCAAKEILSRKLKECERVQAAVVLDAQLSGWFSRGGYECSGIDEFDAVLLAGLYRWGGFRIVVWSFQHGGSAMAHPTALGGRLSWSTSCISLLWGRELVHASLGFCRNVMLLILEIQATKIRARERIKAKDLLAYDLNPLITAWCKWRS